MSTAAPVTWTYAKVVGAFPPPGLGPGPGLFRRGCGGQERLRLRPGLSRRALVAGGGGPQPGGKRLPLPAPGRGGRPPLGGFGPWLSRGLLPGAWGGGGPSGAQPSGLLGLGPSWARALRSSWRAWARSTSPGGPLRDWPSLLPLRAGGLHPLLDPERRFRLYVPIPTGRPVVAALAYEGRATPSGLAAGASGALGPSGPPLGPTPTWGTPSSAWGRATGRGMPGWPSPTWATASVWEKGWRRSSAFRPPSGFRRSGAWETSLASWLTSWTSPWASPSRAGAAAGFV